MVMGWLGVGGKEKGRNGGYIINNSITQIQHPFHSITNTTRESFERDVFQEIEQKGRL